VRPPDAAARGRPALTTHPGTPDCGESLGPCCLSADEDKALDALAHSTTGPARCVERAHALLALAHGASPAEVAAQTGRSLRTIRRWRSRFAVERVLAVFDAPRSGRPSRLTAQEVMKICETAVAQPESLEGQVPLQCWSLRRLSDHLATIGIKVKHERLRQILDAHNVRKKAEVSKQRSNDPAFAEKRDAVVELYTHPPEDSAVICLDQKGPVSLHATPGAKYARADEQPRHDAEYKRHGTIYTLGALLPHVGTVFARAFKHYNSLTLIWFLGWLIPQLPTTASTVYIILDNASAHTAKRVQKWLTDHWSGKGDHGRTVRLVFTPSHAAWLNLIEPFWRILGAELLAGSDFQSPEQFRAALRQYIAYYNRRSHPFIWGRPRKHRVFLVRPIRQRLRGRAGARAMAPKLLRLIARAAA